MKNICFSDSLQSTDHNTEVLDIVGIGFGPSNIAIAIALQENAADLSTIFLERRPSFAWHETMLFDTAMMQVNFLKDLASFRNPRSHFTFVNFLHYQKRLADFTNLQTLFPRRTEFRQYLSWCAHHFDDIVRYSTSATSIETVLHDGVELFRIIAEGPDGAESFLARNVVYSGGIEPRIPFPVVGEGRISHGYNILKEIDNHTPGSHYAVVGAGQSAAEITEFTSAHATATRNAAQVLIPGAAKARFRGAMCHTDCYSTTPIGVIGPGHWLPDGLLLATGFSGGGFKMAPHAARRIYEFLA